MFDKFKNLRSLLFRQDQAKVMRLEKKVDRLQAIVDIFVNEQSYDPNSKAGLNNQKIRKVIINKICSTFKPEVVIETGTFFGLSSGYFASTLGIPVHTAEIDHTYFQVAKYLLRKIDGIHQYHLDSRDFLNELARRDDLRLLKALVYLDAHWYEELPLCEELKIVFGSFESPLVIVDDFQVPWDAGYFYDDYGPGRALTPELIMDIVEELELVIYLPTIPALEETGGKRGCAIIANKCNAEALDKLSELARFEYVL